MHTLFIVFFEFVLLYTHQEEEKMERKIEYSVAEFQSLHRSLGNIRFIGELFKFKVCVYVHTYVLHL